MFKTLKKKDVFLKVQCLRNSLSPKKKSVLSKKTSFFLEGTTKKHPKEKGQKQP